MLCCLNTTFILESTRKAGWQTVTNAPVLVNNQNTVRLDQGPDRQFFRLRRL
jgi:hypothetical protein